MEKTKGIIYKAASVEIQELDTSELRKINKYTLSPLAEEEVYAFKVCAGSNELNDRNFEPFNLAALNDMKQLYRGKTVIKDHERKADNQIARVYDTELIQSDKMTKAGELYTELWLKCYMVKTAENAGLIAEIKGGIKKEVSTGVVAKRAICSICKTDNRKSYCPHFWGKEYDTSDGKKECYFTLDGVKEAYELSFVPVPAQPDAGTRKEAMIDTEKKTEDCIKRLQLEAEYYKNKFAEDAKTE